MPIIDSNFQFPTGSLAPGESYNGPQTGQVGVQQGAGNIGWGTPTAPTGGTNAGSGGFGSQTNWLNTMKESSTPFAGYGDALTGKGWGGWQNFKFDNPTSDWQKNFNSISDPVARMLYGYQGGASGDAGEGLSPYLAKAGISNQWINTMRNAFGGGGRGADSSSYLDALGVDQSKIFNSNVQQVGNQLWRINTSDGTRQLMQDFGNSANPNQANTQWQTDFGMNSDNPWIKAHSTNPTFDGVVAPTPSNVVPYGGGQPIVNAAQNTDQGVKPVAAVAPTNIQTRVARNPSWQWNPSRNLFATRNH